ncbi:hypothetical protein ACFVT8_17745 [Lysinibacillus sp. NPDC058147]
MSYWSAADVFCAKATANVLSVRKRSDSNNNNNNNNKAAQNHIF